MSTREEVAVGRRASDAVETAPGTGAPPGPAARLLLELQARAGNAAVAELLSSGHGAARAGTAFAGAATLARQGTGTAPSPTPGAPGAPPGSVAGQLPPGADVTNLGFSFQIPKGKAIADKASTTDTTTVSVSITHTGITLGMAPPIHIRPLAGWAAVLSPLAFFAVSDCDWSGAEYSFASASVTSISLADTGVGMSIQSQVRGDVTAEVSKLFAGTRAAVAGYDPATDPDPMGTLAAIKANAAAGGGSGGDVGGGDISHLDITASGTLPAADLTDDQHSGVQLAGGSAATLRLTMSGTMADVMDPAKREIRDLAIETDGITLVQGGDPVAKLKRVYVSHGGAVTVGEFEPLGGLRAFAGAAGLGGFVVGGAVGEELGGPPGGAIGGQAGLQQGAGAVHSWGRTQIEAALTPKILEVVRAHTNVLPGLDIAKALGI